MKSFLTGLCFLSLIGAMGQVSHNKLTITHLKGDFYVYTTYRNIDGSAFPSNGMYIVTDAGVVMIDTPWDVTQFQPLLDSIHSRHKKKVVLCLATHFHDDRTGGLGYYNQQGIITFSSLKTKQLCVATGNQVASHHFTNDTTFQIGKYKISTYYPGEGHTKDNIVVWFGPEKILYGGCLVKSLQNSSPGNVADANVPEWPITIRKVIQQFPPPAFVIPGHFEWGDQTLLTHTLRMFSPKK